VWRQKETALSFLSPFFLFPLLLSSSSPFLFLRRKNVFFLVAFPPILKRRVRGSRSRRLLSTRALLPAQAGELGVFRAASRSLIELISRGVPADGRFSPAAWRIPPFCRRDSICDIPLLPRAPPGTDSGPLGVFRVSAHWETRGGHRVLGSDGSRGENGLTFDYGGFPSHTFGRTARATTSRSRSALPVSCETLIPERRGSARRWSSARRFSSRHAGTTTVFSSR
jgi:hypothetical protein